MSKPLESFVKIRRALAADAGEIAAVFGVIAAERIHSAIDQPWTADEERRYVESLSPREAIHVAVDDVQGIVGVQILDLWSPTLTSMAHVGQVGNLPSAGVAAPRLGPPLVDATMAFAREAGYRTLPKSSIGALGFRTADAYHARSSSTVLRTMKC